MGTQIYIQIECVKGHQDREGKKLCLEAELNVIADELATSALLIKNKNRNK